MKQPTGTDTSPSDLGCTPFVDLAPITVLHVDDDPDVAALTETLLNRENPEFEILTEQTVTAGLDRLADEAITIDCVVSDYEMPGMTGIDFLETVREEFPVLPFVLFTGKGSEEVASDAISAGVTEYLQKGGGTEQYAVLADRIENAVRTVRAERSAEQLRSAIETAREGISLLNEDGRFIYVNRAYADALGYDPQDLLGEHWERLYPDDAVARVSEEILPAIPDEGVLRERTRMSGADDTEIVTDHVLSYTTTGSMVCNIRTGSDDSEWNGPLVDVFDALDDLLFFFDEDGSLT